jgi:hypothetical protein
MTLLFFYPDVNRNLNIVRIVLKLPFKNLFSSTYKVSATYLDGFKATSVAIIGGGQAAAKGKAVADAIVTRSRAIFKHLNMADFDATYITSIGTEESFGKPLNQPPRESTLWMAVQHKEKKALDIWAREIASSGTE